MTIRYHSPIRFSTVLGRRIEGEFSGGQVTGNGGMQLLSEVHRRIGLTRSVAGSLEDPRRAASCGHGLLGMLRQRVCALALGEEDLNDHAELRNDLALRAAVGRDSKLASPSTLCRMERRADRGAALAVHDALSGFCRHRMLRWCEGNNVGYIVGIGKNNLLMDSAAGLVAEAQRRHARTGCQGWQPWGRRGSKFTAGRH